MKKKGLLVLLAMATMLTGCGGTETDTSKNKTDTERSISKENKSTDKPKDTPTATNKEDETEFNEDMFDDYYGVTEYGLAHLNITDMDDWCGEGYPAQISVSSDEESDSLLTSEDGEGKYISFYSETIPNGNTVTLVTTDGKKEVWKYDADKETISSGEYCFYKKAVDLVNDIKDSGTTIDGVFTGIEEGTVQVGNNYLKKGEHKLLFNYHSDGSVEATVDGDWNYLDNYSTQYFIIDSDVYYWYHYYDETSEYEGISSGSYDAEAGTITYGHNVLTLVQE